jgi:hypothetical protein
MPKKKRNIGSDRNRVAGGQDHEVKYESHTIGASKQDVRKVVRDVGVSRSKVEDRLSKIR